MDVSLLTYANKQAANGCPDTCCVSIQGLHPSKDPSFVVFEGESFRETLLTPSAVVKCDVLAFGALPGCVTRCFTLTSLFLPSGSAKVTIYATRCRHFLCFSSFFFGRAKNLGICEATEDSSGGGHISGLHLVEPLNWGSLRTAL